jgi:heme/copper-type cytochrome/quinol oxidase subunit 3
MEIPYIFTPRKDTGLVNSKIAIWLFLASEVMLFGGFFSAYVYLRLGADYPWPERSLPVLPGLINTFVLIASSVTVVFAWAALKLRKWRQFQVYMAITVACAALFMVLKGIEYYLKFHHQAVRLHDYSIVEGHLGYEKEDGKLVLDRKGHHIEENMIRIKTEKISFSTKRYHAAWVEEMLAEAKHHHAEIKLAADIKLVVEEGQPAIEIAKAGTTLSLELLKKIKEVHIAALAHNSRLRTEALREAWKTAHEANPGKKDRELAEGVGIDAEALKPRMLGEIPSVTFVVADPVELLFKPRDIKEGPSSSTLRDDTVITGKLQDSPMVFHYVDAIDFQWLVMKAEKKGIAAEAAIENSWLMKNQEFVREAWEWHLEQTAKKQKALNDRYGFKKDGTPVRVLTEKELYRMGWKELAEKGVDTKGVKISGFDKLKEEFMGPNYDARGNETFEELTLPREQIRYASKFTPSWNNYYAIYFTITGLHGLHVIGGALVLLYYLLFGRKMYLSNPEWLANRVEVGGLFWHFVDLIWIFAFPIFYLM